MEYIEPTLTKIDKNKYAVFLMGNFNIDLLKYESHNCTNDFINSLVSHSFLQYILQPTWVTDHSSTIIDNIFSNIIDYETSSYYITTLIADHFAQFLIIKKFHISYKSCSYSTYDYSNFGKEKFIHDFTLIDWSSLDDTNLPVNEHFKYFYKKTNECISLHVPKKKVTKNGLKLRSKPWVKTRIQKLMHYRDTVCQHEQKFNTIKQILV